MSTGISRCIEIGLAVGPFSTPPEQFQRRRDPSLVCGADARCFYEIEFDGSTDLYIRRSCSHLLPRDGYETD
jgi:hypothetical protein